MKSGFNGVYYMYKMFWVNDIYIYICRCVILSDSSETI